MIFRFFRQLSLAKRIASLLVGLVFLAIVAGVILFMNLNTIVKTGVEKIGPKVVGVPLVVDDVDISIFGGTAEIKGFKMGSPENYDAENMFTLDRITVDMDLLSVLGEEIVIHTIEIDAPRMVVERKDGKMNWLELMERLKKEPTEEGKKKVSIGEITVTNATVAVRGVPLLGSAEPSLSLPPVTIRDFSTGDDDQLTVREATLQFIEKLYYAILENFGRLGDLIPRDALNNMQDSLRDAMDGNLDDLGGVLDRAREGSGGLLDGILGGDDEEEE